MLTQKGTELYAMLDRRRVEKREADHRRLLEEADRWAAERADRLLRECESTEFGTTIEFVEFEDRVPNEKELARIAALERLLGVTFGKDRIGPSVHGPREAPPYSLQMELGRFLDLLEDHRSPS